MPQERRCAPRMRCYLPARLYPHGEAKVIETLTKDLSTGGLKCLSPIPKPVAAQLMVELSLGAGEEALNLRANVSWFQEIPQSDQFYLGIVFQDLPDKTRERLSRYIDLLSIKYSSSSS